MGIQFVLGGAYNNTHLYMYILLRLYFVLLIQSVVSQVKRILEAADSKKHRKQLLALIKSGAYPVR